MLKTRTLEKTRLWLQSGAAALLALSLNTFGATTAQASADAASLRSGAMSTKAPMMTAPAAVVSAISATEVITAIKWAMPGRTAYICMSNPATAEAALWAGKYKAPIKRPSYNPWFQTPGVCADSDTAETIVPMITGTELLGNAFAVVYPGDIITASDPVSLPVPTSFTYWGATREVWLSDGKWRAFYGPYLGEATQVSVNGTVLSSSDYRIVGPGLLMTKVMTDFGVTATTLITTPYGLAKDPNTGRINQVLENEMYPLQPGYVGKLWVNPSGLMDVDHLDTVLTEDGRKTYSEIRPWDDQDAGTSLWLRTSPTAPAVNVNKFYVESGPSWMTGNGDRTMGWISMGSMLVAPNTILSTGWFTSAQTGRRIEYSARTALEAMSQEVRTTYTFSDPLGIGMLEMIPSANFNDFSSYKNKSLVFVGDPARQGGFAHILDDRFDRGWGMGYQLNPGVVWKGFAVERTYVQVRAGALITGGQIENNTAYFTTSVQLGASTTITDAANVYNGNGSLSYSFSQQPTDEWWGEVRYNYGDVVHQPQSKLELSYAYSSTDPAATVISFTHRMRLQWDTPPSFDAALIDLSIAPGQLSPTFVSTTLEYSAEVTRDVASTTVTPTLSDPNAIYTITGMTNGCTPAMSPAVCTLSTGVNIISVTVTAEDGVTTKEYVLSITREPPPDASLGGLTIAPGSLSPTFAPTTTSYTTEVPNGTTSAAVTATTSDVSATVAYASTAGSCTPGNASPSTCAIASSGTSTITITITAPDLTTTEIYTIAVTVAEAGASLPNHLTWLEASDSNGASSYPATPALVTDVLHYTTTVPYTLTPIMLGAAAEDPAGRQHFTATLALVDGTILPTTIRVPDVGLAVDLALEAGITGTVTLTTYNAAGTAPLVYTVFIDREPADVNASSDANLSNLEIDPGTLAPVFVSSTNDYAATVPNGTTSALVTATTSDVSATIAYASTAGSCTPGNASPSNCDIAPSGTTTITITITAADLATTDTYTIVVTVAPPGASSDASLSGLEIDPGTLTPAFVSTTTSYTAEMPAGTTSAVVTATTSDVSATIAYASTAGSCTPAGGRATGPVAPTCDIAASGITTITITITAPDGTTQEYVIVVTVEELTGPHASELVIDIPGLTPAFVSTTLHYQTEVPSGTNQLVVTPTLSVGATAAYSSTAGVCVDNGESGTCPLFPTDTTTVTIGITDGATTRNYTIRATRPTAPGSLRHYWFPVVPVLK